MLFERAANDLEEGGVFQDHDPFPDLPQMPGGHTDQFRVQVISQMNFFQNPYFT